MMAMDSQALVKLGPSIPESLGNFHLDDHNVVEWSDSDIPGVRHKARKETGKWINPVNNADIKYHKQEDCKKTDRGQEQTRTEVIHGQAPDSEFQIVRSHSHYTGSDPDKFNSRVQSSSTSYQMSSSRGVRSTSKSTSNRTTTKTVTVGGGRSEDFEQLGLTFQPLDTSTQRERINVSRSGTMGVRRPPTRRHTPVTPTPIPIVSTTSPDDSEVEMKDEIIVDSDDNLRNTPPIPRPHSHHIIEPHHHHHHHQGGGLSIVEFKDVTPKFRGVMVGFPVEIQLELQSRLRNSSHRNGEIDSDEEITGRGEEIRHQIQSYPRKSHPDRQGELDNQKNEEGSTSRILYGLSPPAPPRNEVMKENDENSTFDFHQRKKSYELESFDSHTESRSRPLRSNFNSNNYLSNYLKLFPPSDDRDDNVKSILDRNNQPSRSPSRSPVSSPTPPSRWDFYNKIKSGGGGDVSKTRTLFDDSVSSKTSHFKSLYDDDSNFDRSTEIPIQIEDHRFKVDKYRDLSGNELDGSKLFGQDNYMITSSSQMNFSSQKQIGGVKSETEENPRGYYTHTPNEELGGARSPSPLPTSLERSRRLLQMLDETPSVLPKLERNRILPASQVGLDGRTLWDEGQSQGQDGDQDGEDEETEWQTQRQLSFLNDSLSRILDAGRTSSSDTSIFFNKFNKSQENVGLQEQYGTTVEESEYNSSTFSNREFEDSEMDINGNIRPKLGQVSQTWISSGDINSRPSQKVRDKDVTTSISATHDHLKRGAKKVEFCKTEVHFTADSGKFHIVETDENKPSTSHLFRRKKKDRTKTTLQSIAPSEKSEIEKKTDTIVTTTSIQKDLESHVRESNTGENEHWVFKTDDAAKNKGQTFPSSDQTSNESDKINNALSSSFYDMLKKNTINESHILDLKPNTKSRFVQLSQEEDQDAEFPSQNILSEYEEMKIQRYLTHLKSPSTLSNSSPKQIFNFDLVEGAPSSPSSSYRFNNVLYENGSFIPLATRRSLIEMNNNKKSERVGREERSESDNRSSVSITPNNASSQTPRLARLEARVATARPNPQITSVELRYEFDSDSNEVESHGRQIKGQALPRSPSPSHPSTFSSLTPTPTQAYERKDRSSFLNKRGTETETESELLSSYRNPEIYSSRSERISDLIKRSYYKNPELDWTPGGGTKGNKLETKNNNLSMSTATVSSTSNNKSASRSIVTIGEYDTPRNNNQALSEPSPEPVLSMDHTWKGPAYVDSSNVGSDKNVGSSGRSLTLLKLGQNEPEWISKARNREHRIKDWESVGKQRSETYSSPSQPPDQPPWLDDFIRPRSKTSLAVADRVGVPKISVVYPWQRQTELTSRGLESNKFNTEQEMSHIVSIVPTPSLTSTSNHGTSYLDHSRGPKSLPDLPVLQLVNKDEVIERDSEILSSSHHVMKNRGTNSVRGSGTNNKGSTQKNQHFPDTGTLTTPTSTGRSSSSHSKMVGSSTLGTDHTSTTKVSGVSSRRSKTVDPVIPTTTTTGPNLNTHALKEGVIRRSGRSSNKNRTDSTSRERPGVTGGSNTSNKRSTTTVGKESPTTTSASTTTTIHRHPLVKVSKLPVRKNLPPKSPKSSADGKTKGSKMGSKENPDEPEKSMKKQGGGGSQTRGGLSASPTNKTDSQSQQPWRRK